MSSEKNRWWEAYLVRYLSGSIVGSFCLLSICGALVYRANGGVPKIDFFVKDFPYSLIALIVPILGLIYAYTISAPIAIYHYARADRSKVEQYVRYIWLGWSLSILTFVFGFDFIFMRIL